MISESVATIALSAIFVISLAGFAFIWYKIDKSRKAVPQTIEDKNLGNQ